MTLASLDFATMTPAELADLAAQVTKAKKTAQDAAKARYAEMGRELVEAVLAEQPCQESATSTRVGSSTTSLPIEIDGVKYTFYVSIKDVAATEARDEAVKAGTLVLEKPKRKQAQEAAATVEAEDRADGDTTVVTLPTKPAA